MPDPVSLKFMSTVVCMRALLLENPVEDNDDNNTALDRTESQTRHYLTQLLETDCFTAVSEEILYRIVKFCPSSLTNNLLHALTPPYIRDLNLDDCKSVHLMGLVQTLKKCGHVHKVNLSCCSQLMLPDIFTFMGMANIALTTVVVEDNANVTDEVVHAMLRNLPCLETLNISECRNTSNDVFLLDKTLQFMRELSPHPIKDDEYACNLTSVDISGCNQLDGTAVKHLVSLCGPKLIDVNISWTSVNCIALLHLAGYSMPAILDFMLTDDALKSDKELKTVLLEYRELRDTYAEQYEEDLNKEPQLEDENIVGETNKSNNTVDDLEEIAPMDENDSDTVTEEKASGILSDMDIKLEGLTDQAEDSHNEDTGLNCRSVPSLIQSLSLEQSDEEDVETEENELSEKFNKGTALSECKSEVHENDNGLVERDKEKEEYKHPESGVSIESPAKKKVEYWQNGEEVNYEDYKQELNTDRGLEGYEDLVDLEACVEESLKDSREDRNENSKKEKGVQKAAASVPVCSDKLNFEYTKQLFEPKIVRLNINGMKYASRRPNLGQLCLEKFLEVNQGLQKFAVSWTGLTCDFFRKIVANLSELIEVELEECTMLTSGGVAALGKHCGKCRRVNLRGVVFISDSGLVPFLSNKNLEHLSLAESNNISDKILIHFSKRLNTSLTSLDLSLCEEITEKGVNAICSTCTNLKRLWLRKCPVSDFTLRVLSETNFRVDLVEISVESADTSGDGNLTDEGILTIANNFTNLRIIDISWNLAITDLSVSAVIMNCCLLEEANLKGLKQITVQPFLPMISDKQQESETEGSEIQPNNLPERSTVYAPNLHVLDLDYSDLVDDQLLQRIVNVCRGTLQVTDYYGQKLKPEI